MFKCVETMPRHLTKHAMMGTLTMETDAVQLASFNRVITACLLDQRVSVVLVLAASLIAQPVPTVQVFHALLVYLDTVYREIPVFKCVEITLKHQVKAVMMETP